MNEDPPDPDLTELPSTEAMANGAESRQVGRYHLLQKLGEGGMGEVWLAEQTEPVKRRVALKVIKQGMDTKQVVARFEAERQALAMMDHPSVAKVLDAGTTPEGRPYFVMEHVRGVPITAHCDRNKLDNRERMELFVQVCEGVQHAHQKAIIHRDLKPSNVLVSIQDGKAIPKIIDFGVAKATAQKLTEKTMFTQLGVLIGTPEYMSPEQAEMTGQDVDTRTDVYSLGVMLYELMVGALPFEPKALRAEGFDGIRRKIRDEDPPRPSMRLSTLGDRSTESASLRRVDLPTLRRQLRGDLDWITMKALEKDRMRRYGSPQELAADIERHLNHEPVQASPPSAVYRARKFVRRHRLSVAAAGVVLAALLLGIGGTTIGLIRAVRAERQTRVEAETAQRVSGFLTGLFEGVDPAESRGETITLQEVLDRASEKIDSELADEPIVQARLMHVMGKTYYHLSLWTQAEQLLEGALAIRRQALGDEHPDTLKSMFWLADTYCFNGRPDGCRGLYTELLETRRRVLGDDHPDTLMAKLGLAERNYRDTPEAETILLELLPTLRRVLGNDHGTTLATLRALGDHYTFTDRYDEAEVLLREWYDTQMRKDGPDDPSTLNSMFHLCRTLMTSGRYDEAESICEQNLEGERRVRGMSHNMTIRSVRMLATLRTRQGRHDEAERLRREMLETHKRLLGNDHRHTLTSTRELAEYLRSRHRYEETDALFREAIAAQRRVLGVDHEETLKSQMELGISYLEQEHYPDAEPLLRETVAAQRRVLGVDHENTLRSQVQLAICYYKQKRYPEAEPLLLETIEGRRRIGADTGALYAMKWLAQNHEHRGQYADARAVYDRILEGERRIYGEERSATLRTVQAFAETLGMRGDYVEAEALCRAVVEASRRVSGEEHTDTLSVVESLAASIGSQGRTDEAESLLLANLETKKRVLGEDHPETALTLYNLACVEGTRGNKEKAMDWLRRSVDAGWTDTDLMRTDPSLQVLHGPVFETLVERVRQNASG